MSKKLFIVHGWTYTLDQWTELVSLLTKQGYKVIQLKVPGLTEPSSKAWDIDDYVAWLQKKLKDEPQPVVIGHSNGGRIALSFASQFQDKLGKLILIDSAGIYHGDVVSKTKRGTFKVLTKVGKPLARVPIVKKVFYKAIGAKDYYKAPEHMKQTMKNMLAADRQMDFSHITVPTQLIWGSQDTATPIGDADKLQKALHKAPLHIVQGAGHSPHGSHPEEVAQVITSFVGPAR